MKAKKISDAIIFVILCVLVVLFITPVYFVVMNSFKGKLYISDNPFALPTAETFSRLTNYINGIQKTNFFGAFGWSLFITVFSVAAILLFTSMTAYYIIRVKGRVTSILYYMFVFSMIVPFQMVMFSMSKLANLTHLNNPVGIVFLYLGFGAGQSLFMFSGFIKSIPLEIEEAAMIDGCNPLQTFFGVVMPILKPTAITVSILNAMWIWNDYLLPFLVIGNSDKTTTLTLELYFAKLKTGQYGNPWELIFPAVFVTIIPIIIIYILLQKWIINGVIEGAVKG